MFAPCSPNADGHRPNVVPDGSVLRLSILHSSIVRDGKLAVRMTVVRDVCLVAYDPPRTAFADLQ